MDETLWKLIVIVLCGAVIAEGLVLVGVMRTLGSLLLRVAPAHPGVVEGGPAVGSDAALQDLAVSPPGVLVFLSPGCSMCESLIPALRPLAKAYPTLTLIAIPGGDEDERAFYAQKIGDLARPDLFHLYREWDVPGTPFAVGVDASGTVRGTGVVNNLEHLESLVTTTLANHVPTPAELPLLDVERSDVDAGIREGAL